MLLQTLLVRWRHRLLPKGVGMRSWWGRLIGLGFLLCSILPFSVSPALAADVNALYKQHCLKCHGKEGKAVDWTNKAEMRKLTDQFLFEIIWKGGEGVGKSESMPAYNEKLTEQEAKELAAFTRSFAK